MTKRLKWFITILLGVVAAACCIAGCKVGEAGRDEVLKDYNGGHVTYYANGGCFNRNTSIVVREMYYKDADVPFFDVTEETGDINVMHSGYDFVGWYLPARYDSGEHKGEIKYTYTYKENGEEKTVPAYPKLKDDGTPEVDRTEARPLFYCDGSKDDILEKNIKVVPSSTMVDASRKVGEKEELIVCASWKPALKFVFKLAAEEGEYVSGGETYRPGDVIAEIPFGRDTVANPGETIGKSFDGMTFVANYKEETCENFVTDYDRADYEGKTEIVVWSKFIKGSWTIVRNNANRVLSMFKGLSREGSRYYLLEDVDCSSVNFSISDGVKGEIEGNGHKLTNIKINRESDTQKNNAKIYPLFGEIASTAKISNLTIDGVEIKVKGIGNMTFYAVCGGIAEGATFQNFTIGNITANVTIPVYKGNYVTNAQNGETSHWIFGGSGTDEQIASSHGITLTGTNTLNIK